MRQRHPRVELRFWCDRPFAPQARSIVGTFDETIPTHTIIAGKLRRYHHLTLWQHLTWPSLVFKNLGDSLLVAAGVVQSFFKLLAWRPDVIFTKGGYVCLPVGIAAHWLRIPLVIHDSDAHPGLTNRILSRWAISIATGAPLEYYQYPKSRSHYVGIPIHRDFRPYTAAEQRQAKQEWGMAADKPLLVVTGGGLGAKRINDTIALTLSKLQQHTSVILVAGAGQYDELRSVMPVDSDRFKLFPFITTMPKLLAAADIVATRAGATTILELAASQKPTILIPNAKLTGGHQVKNAAVYAEAGAVRVVNEDEMVANPKVLISAVQELLEDPKATQAMARRFGAFAKPNAANDMADLILAARRR